ncbi:hypothetical protein [Ruminococcus difficilis]|uniref:Uncharacterized protein n=1 Tax=Ruminococcus difficilis TaxID=2763069 RepID=A0A934TYY6_9FIRM|nr:hypothetical protein [Ruminococcus difficilis]MBK6087945.1 hypothetical protein [Ruminococcus difficilis]
MIKAITIICNKPILQIVYVYITEVRSEFEKTKRGLKHLLFSKKSNQAGAIKTMYKYIDSKFAIPNQR